MADLSDLIVYVLSLIIPAVATIILTYLFVNRYERKKDKIKLKQELIDIAVKYGNTCSKKLGLYYEKDNTEDNNQNIDLKTMTQKINSLNDESNLLSDKLSALFSIYSKNYEEYEEMDKIIINIVNIFNELAGGKLFFITYEIYSKKLGELRVEFEKIYNLIRDIKINYKVWNINKIRFNLL